MKRVLGFFLSLIIELMIIVPLCYLWENSPNKDAQLYLFPSLAIAGIMVAETVSNWVKKVLEND